MTAADTRTFSCCSSTPRRPAAAVPRSSYTRQRASQKNEPGEAVCHQPERRQRPRHSSRIISTRPRRATSFATRPWATLNGFMFAVLIGLLFCCNGVAAGNPAFDRHLGRHVGILIDRSDPPALPGAIDKRQGEASTRIPAPTASSSDESGSSTGEDGSLVTASSISDEDLPQPFDTSLGNNFTSTTCPEFFLSLLNNDTFQDCYPFSLLLETSGEFFNTLRSPLLLTQTLTATCNPKPSFETCETYLSDLATRTKKSSNCGPDLDNENPPATQLLAGLKAYTPLYHAACLTNADSGAYCFADAVTNASATGSAHVYHLPLGVELAGQGKLACNSCLKDTMGVFSSFAEEDSQSNGLGDTFQGAAEKVTDVCGEEFLGTATKAASSGMRTNAGSRAVAAQGWTTVAWAAVVGGLWGLL